MTITELRELASNLSNELEPVESAYDTLSFDMGVRRRNKIPNGQVEARTLAKLHCLRDALAEASRLATDLADYCHTNEKNGTNIDD